MTDRVCRACDAMNRHDLATCYRCGAFLAAAVARPAESYAARRHRYALTARAVASVDTAAQVLEAYAAGVSESPAAVLQELRALADWRPQTLQMWVHGRRTAPVSPLSGDELHARPLLELRRYALLGLLAAAAEQAFREGHPDETLALCEAAGLATLELIGRTYLAVALRPEVDDALDADLEEVGQA